MNENQFTWPNSIRSQNIQKNDDTGLCLKNLLSRLSDALPPHDRSTTAIKIGVTTVHLCLWHVQHFPSQSVRVQHDERHADRHKHVFNLALVKGAVCVVAAA